MVVVLVWFCLLELICLTGFASVDTNPFIPEDDDDDDYRGDLRDVATLKGTGSSGIGANAEKVLENSLQAHKGPS